MQKILIISDTHSYIDNKIIKYIHDVDEVWHAGDIGNIEVTDKIASIKPLKAVYGNIDDHIIRSVYKENLFFNCENIPVFMTHIGGYPGRYERGISQLLLTHKPKLFICGHSHILKVIYDKKYNLLHINPGAIGKNGFHSVRTMIRLDIDNSEMKNLQIIEFPRK